MMVCFFFVEYFVCINDTFSIHQHFKDTFAFAVNRVPMMEHLPFGKFVDQSDKLPCFEVFSVVTFFEIVKFFKIAETVGG